MVTSKIDRTSCLFQRLPPPHPLFDHQASGCLAETVFVPWRVDSLGLELFPTFSTLRVVCLISEQRGCAVSTCDAWLRVLRACCSRVCEQRSSPKSTHIDHSHNRTVCGCCHDGHDVSSDVWLPYEDVCSVDARRWRVWVISDAEEYLCDRSSLHRQNGGRRALVSCTNTPFNATMHIGS